MTDSAWGPIARRIKEVRRQCKVTQHQCAAWAQMPDQQWAKYEQGKAVPGALVLMRILDALNTAAEKAGRATATMGWLTGGR